jgi:CRP/FNR family transcriptional regulator, cyclic AMP receptor protein
LTIHELHRYPSNSAQLLADVSLFSTLLDDERTELLGRLRRRRYRKGEMVFLRGDLGRDLYLIESGTVKICLAMSDGKEITLAMLGPGEFFGELALLDGEPRSSDAVTMEPSSFLLLERSEFLQFVEEHPRVAHRVMEVLSRRLRDNNQLVQDAAFYDIAARLARVILRLAETVGQADGAGVVISRRLTQNELAGMVGTTRESVNKWLMEYERQGLIERHNGLIRVLKPEGLQRRIY